MERHSDGSGTCSDPAPHRLELPLRVLATNRHDRAVAVRKPESPAEVVRKPDVMPVNRRDSHLGEELERWNSADPGQPCGRDIESARTLIDEEAFE